MLIITGLIVGSVIVGKDMIGAAEVRATLTQLGRFNAEVNNFRTRFGGLPGDLLETDAAKYSLYDSGFTVAGSGNGDNLITDIFVPNLNRPWGETVMFWRHLSDAKVIDGSYGAKSRR